MIFKEYFVVQAYTATTTMAQFSEVISSHMRSGWQPLGPPQMEKIDNGGIYIIQALVRES